MLKAKKKQPKTTTYSKNAIHGHFIHCIMYVYFDRFEWFIRVPVRQHIQIILTTTTTTTTMAAAAAAATTTTTTTSSKTAAIERRRRLIQASNRLARCKLHTKYDIWNLENQTKTSYVLAASNKAAYNLFLYVYGFWLTVFMNTTRKNRNENIQLNSSRRTFC